MRRISGRKISQLLAKKHLTASRFADDVTLDRDTVYDVLNDLDGATPRRQKTAEILAAALGVSIDAIAADELRPDTPSRSAGPAELPIPEGLRRWICPFDTYMAERTLGFVGRDFVFDAVSDFVGRGAASGYLLIRGVPGIGKTALLGELIKRRNLSIHHFNIALQAINTPRQFLGNICARLIVDFHLAYTALPEQFDQDGALLNALLHDASQQTTDQSPLIVPVDALDEVEQDAGAFPQNPLYLPPVLPPNVYFVITTRPSDEHVFQAENLRVFELAAASAENLDDARRYILSHATREGTRHWMSTRKLTLPRFADLLLSRSEGNFMYLHHVLPAIENGGFGDIGAESLPQGLRAYYAGHWERMRRKDPDRFAAFATPIVCVLGAARNAVSVDQLAEWTKLDLADVQRVLSGWMEFLQEENGSRGKAYRVYHNAFRDFLQEEVDPGLAKYHAMIADAGLAKVRRRRRGTS
jgi:transcriptional regulator with XRE-family HTH domain